MDIHLRFWVPHIGIKGEIGETHPEVPVEGCSNDGKNKVCIMFPDIRTIGIEQMG